ncbi:MAG: hypothetical protein RL318_1629 [Fibrobacterota bacterium]|jgi:hypothetical protein
MPRPYIQAGVLGLSAGIPGALSAPAAKLPP